MNIVLIDTSTVAQRALLDFSRGPVRGYQEQSFGMHTVTTEHLHTFRNACADTTSARTRTHPPSCDVDCTVWVLLSVCSNNAALEKGTTLEIKKVPRICIPPCAGGIQFVEARIPTTAQQMLRPMIDWGHPDLPKLSRKLHT